MKGIYPCILTKGESAAYVVEFPDIAGATQGANLYEALEMAEDAANLMITHFEDTKKEIPSPTPPEKVVVPEGAFMTLIRVDTDEYRKS